MLVALFNAVKVESIPLNSRGFSTVPQSSGYSNV
jgi:hypothetical protein